MKKTIWLSGSAFLALTGATLAHWQFRRLAAPPVNAEICAPSNIKGPIEHAELDTRDRAFGFDLELADTPMRPDGSEDFVDAGRDAFRSS